MHVCVCVRVCARVSACVFKARDGVALNIAEFAAYQVP